MFFRALSKNLRPAHLINSLAATILASIGLHAVGAPAANEPTAEDLASRAEKLLDQFEGNENVLTEAEKAITASLKKQPHYSHAMVESARLTLMKGSESPESLQAAELMLQGARNNDFNYGRTYVFQGYVYMKMGNVGEASKAFFTARRLASTDPWFKANYADYLQLTGDIAGARKNREEFVASGVTNRRALTSAYMALLNAYLGADDRPKADGAYTELVRLSPTNAWIRGDYAREVILWFLDFDAGQRYAEEALAIMDYPHARATLSLARYGKWAAAKRARKDPKVVLALLKDAQANDPDARNVPSCALQWPPLAFVRQSLEALGARHDNTPVNFADARRPSDSGAGASAPC
jgi:tetratricopeptide (TPR) repeat protein